MADDLNSANFTGTVVRDAEISYTPGGLAILKFDIANNTGMKSKDGWGTWANFLSMEMMGKVAERVQQYLTKGQKVAVKATVKQDRWEKDGQKRSKIKFKVIWIAPN